MKRNYKAFATLTIISGVLHFLVVSMMHRENFLELWFFTAFGLAQLFLGIQVLIQKNKSKFLLPGLIINILFTVLWLMTRMFNAPFATYSEGLTSFDSLIALFQIIATWIGFQILRFNKIPSSKMFIVGGVAVLFGLMNYGVAKASESIFKSIPMSQHVHKHSIMDMFKAPVKSETSKQFNVMGIDMNEEQAREHCNLPGMEQMEVCAQFMDENGKITPVVEEVYVPEGHDNSDGHHG